MRCETCLRRQKEFAREESRDPRDPRIRRLRDDDVVLPRGQQEMRPSIADDEMRTRIGKRVAIVVVEEM